MERDGALEGRIRVERDGAVATVLLDNPASRNAVNRAMWQALPGAMDGLGADPAVKAVVLAGAGGAAFSAGADISEFAAVYATAEEALRQNRFMRAGIRAVHDLHKPVIARVEGPCIGGGLALALNADVIFAASAASFAVPPARLGALYHFDDARRLVMRIGEARAADLVFSGRTLEAAEALAIGLVERVVPEADLPAAVAAYAKGLCRLSQRTIRNQKRIFREIATGAPEETETARRLFDETFTSEDFREGYRAFLEKRRPRFPFS